MLRTLFSRFSFRAKIIFSAAFVSTLSLVLISIAFLVQDGLSFRKSFAAENLSKTEILAHTCASAVGFHDPEFATRVLSGLAASPEIMVASIYFSDDTILAEYRRIDISSALGFAELRLGSHYDGDQLDTIIPILFQGIEVGTIAVRAEVPNLWSRLGSFGLLLTGVAFLSLIVSLRLGRTFFQALTAPIQELEATTIAVTQNDDYSVRAKKFSEDELGRLTDAFNTMLSRIQEREAALRDSENRFSGLLNRLGEAVFRMTVPDGKFEYFSPAAKYVFGYDANEFLARPGILQLIVHPDSAVYLKLEHEKLLTGQAAAVWEYRIIDASGQERYILQTNAFQYDEAGKLIALEGCCTDISARKRADDEKQRMEFQLNQAHKLEALGTLAGGIAHDFNNILGAIMGYAELAAMDLAPDDPVQEYLQQVSLAGRRATNMVQKILTFSRQGDQGMVPVQMDAVVEEAISLIRPSLPIDVKVETHLPKNLGQVMADSNQIHQIVMNLCTNAGYAMENGGGTLEVALTQITVPEKHQDLTEDMAAGVYLQLRITDSGSGIPPDLLGRVFEPFFTTKPQGKGTGMGLAMVYGIVLDHGGNILVTSTEGHGTTFRVLLPVTLRLAVQKSNDETNSTEGVGRVLLVDDEEMLVNLVRRTLGNLGYEVDAYTEPGEALKAFQADPDSYDIMVTDLTMPGLTGRELAREVQKISPDLPIIICSGYNKFANQETADSLGIYAFAQKPLKVNELGNLIASAIKAGHQTAND